jgi:uncharacterized protein
MAHLEELPLFPLHTVLFPHAPMQLHVFEERYREMVQRCLDFEQPFGVVLIKHGSEVGDHAEPYLVGTAVRVDSVRTYDDGRMDVTVHGEWRFRVRKLDESRPYLVGLVEPVAELEATNPDRVNALAIRAEEIFRMWIEGSFGRPGFEVKVEFPEDPASASFLISYFLPVDNLVKQRLLETTDTAERFAELIPLLETQIVEAKTQMVYRVGSDQMSEWVNPN